jgi:hypothetical protein
MIEWKMDGETHWIDGNGYIFPPRGPAENLVSIHANASPPIQVLDVSAKNNGIEDENMDEKLHIMPKEYIDGVFSLITQAPEGTTLVYNERHGFGWSDPHGWNVFFGTQLDGIDSKIHVYKAVVEELEGEGITPKLINVANVHSPFYRK